VITAVNGVAVEDRDHYQRILRNFTLGQDVRLEVAGQAGKRRVAVALQSFTNEKALDMAGRRWGMTVAARGRSLVISGVRPGSPAQQLGLKSGDLLLKVAGDAQVASVDDFSPGRSSATAWPTPCCCSWPGTGAATMCGCGSEAIIS
jgi:serine protease Do